MWTIERGRLVSPESKLTYIHKDQLLAVDPQGVCKSIEIFCPDIVKVSKLPWQDFWYIKTHDWVLEVIKIDGMARSITPLTFKDIASVAELYKRINKGDRKSSAVDSKNPRQTRLLTTFDPDYPA